jgi:hypothetical protein
MAKRVQSISFKNAEFRVTKDEINGEKKIWIMEYLKDEEVITDFDEILQMFDGEENISISIKVEKGLNE